MGSRHGGRGLWIYLNANALGRPKGQQEQWWEGAEAPGLEAPLEICSAASGSVPSTSLGWQPWGLTRALPVNCNWAEGLHCRWRGAVQFCRGSLGV